MDSYTVWWEVTSAMVVISGLGGALVARPESRIIGLILGGLAAAYSVINLVGSLDKEPGEVAVTTAIVIFVTVVMLIVFAFSWFLRRRRD